MKCSSILQGTGLVSCIRTNAQDPWQAVWTMKLLSKQKQPHDGPGSRQASLYSMKSGLKVGKGDQGCWGRLGADPQSSDSPNKDFSLKRNVRSLNITCTYYPDSLIFFLTFHFLYFEMKREKNNIFKKIYNIYKKLIMLTVSWENWVCRRAGREMRVSPYVLRDHVNFTIGI